MSEEVEEDDDADATTVEEEIEKGEKLAARPENGMKKVLFNLDDAEPTPTQRTVSRSVSFPSKLLARRKSMSAATTPSTGLATRRSEALSSGYFCRALRALRGEDPSGRMSMPPIPSPISDKSIDRQIQRSSPTPMLQEFRNEMEVRQAELERYLAEIEPATLDDGRRNSTDSATTAHSDEFAFGFPSPGWSMSNEVHMPDFDTHYDRYEYASEDDDEENDLESFPLPATHLPHIRVTSH